MIIYKDILKKLNTAGYNTNRLRKERLLSESTIQGIREGKPLTAKTIDTVCLLLNCQPNNIMQVVKGESEKKSSTEQKPMQSATQAANSREITAGTETKPEAKKIDLQALCEEYGKDAILSVMGQINIMGKYGNEVLQELVKYAKEQEPEQSTEPYQIEPEAEPLAETLSEDNTDHLLELQAVIEAKKAAQDKAAEDAQRAEEERIEREKAENVAEIMAIAERIRSGEELKEDPEKEQARNVSKVLANTQYYQ